jgi:hypothetical protein
MLRQLAALRDNLETPTIDLRIIPFELGMYRSLRVPYVVFEFGTANSDDILYLENAEGERLLRDIPGAQEEEDPTSPRTYLEIFWELQARTSKEQSAALIDKAQQTIEASPPPIALALEPPPTEP